ncbi:chitin deacetylase [Apophysomyces ossiformis]|uniref:Chitin deacetylase n=1 Tax=Apophysomyces ossiformis TaxID=679940 RepID=A0A8H7BLM1_9FUNG|nr:chitin deacetylase [Apophysomyces ossiformis]
MLPKLFVLAAVALSAVNAQTGKFQFKETYPDPGSVPKPKPEWMELLKSANISNAPVLKANGDDGPQQKGTADPYCDWTFTGCTRDTDIVACPKGQWGITYDDGPTEFSPALYDFLDKTQQKATLFMIGGQVVRFPDLTLRAYKTGHELAMHTWSHSYMTTLTNEQLVAELKWNELAIKEVTGVSPRFFRPPYGDIDDRVRDVAKALGFTPVIWNHDTDDWKAGESTSFKPEWIDSNVTSWAQEAKNAKVGGISLEHDLYKVTVDAAIRVLPTLQKAYKVTTVGQCTGQQSYKEGNGAATNGTATAASTTTVASTTTAAASTTPAGSSSAAPAGSSPASPNASNAGQQSGDQKPQNAGNHLTATGAGLALAVAASYLLA